MKAGIVAVVVLAVTIGWWYFGNSDAGVEGSAITAWKCTKPECGQTFHLTVKQLSDFYKVHYGEPLPCPKCGSRAQRVTNRPAATAPAGGM